MKAALFVLASLVSSASAGGTDVAVGNACQIPPRFAPIGGAANRCAGTVSTGYNVNVVCQSAFDNTAANVAQSAPQTYAINAANANGVSDGAAAAVVQGCIVPGAGWGLQNGGAAGDLVTVAALDANNCGGFTVAYTAPAATTTEVITASVTCNTDAGYYPSATTIEGNALCYPGNGVAVADGNGEVPFGNNNAAPSGNVAQWSQSFARTQANQIANWIDTADGTSDNTASFNCVQGCALASTLCANAALHSNVLAWGTFGTSLANFASVPTALQGASIMTATCTVKPDTRITVACKNAPDTMIVGNCAGGTNTVATQTAGTLTFATTPNCGSADGAATGYFVNPQWVGTLDATAIPGFPAAAVTVAKQYADVATSGSFGGITDEHDDRRTLQTLATASTYLATVTGCGTGTTRSECVQVALNRARCQGVTFDASARCFANSQTIACPSHANGYRCETSSKKGLLGLLGLLGIIPLALLCCLLLCCLLLPCLLKRKKTEGDVHFATFDPHAAPVAGSVCAPGTAFAPSIGAVGPYPTAVY